jgi:hypothetical protein
MVTVSAGVYAVTNPVLESCVTGEMPTVVSVKVLGPADTIAKGGEDVSRDAVKALPPPPLDGGGLAEG